MNRFVKSAVAIIAGISSTLVPISNASAGDWFYNEDGIIVERRVIVRERHHRNNDDALAAGLIGLAAGAIIVGALNSQPRPAPVYQQRRVHRQVPIYDTYPDAPPAPRHPQVIRYQTQVEPWSREWYRYCANRYRSFNPQTGTFRGYNGRNHFCVVN